MNIVEAIHTGIVHIINVRHKLKMKKFVRVETLGTFAMSIVKEGNAQTMDTEWRVL